MLIRMGGDINLPGSSHFIIARDPFRAIRRGRQLFQRKFTNYGSITAMPDGMVNTAQVQGVNADLRVRPFFADGRRFSLRELTVVALRDVMGLLAGDSLTAAAALPGGGTVTTPSRFVLDGSMDTIVGPPQREPEDVSAPGSPEIPESLIDFFEFYLLHYFQPGTYQQTRTTRAGLKVMEDIGCTTCHIQNLQIDNDRRVADVETVYDPVNGVFNSLFATGTTFFNATPDSNFPNDSMKEPLGGPFLVRNIFTDLKRHDLGSNFHERNFNGTITTQFMTAPLWGVGSTPPYGHDGRNINLREVILRHGGEAQAQRDAFARLPENKQDALMKFLESLVLFPPDDTAPFVLSLVIWSNLRLP